MERYHVTSAQSCRSRGQDDGKRFKLDPQRVVFSLRYAHNGVPPDFDPLLFGDSRLWLAAVVATLLGGLNRRVPQLFDQLHR